MTRLPPTRMGSFVSSTTPRPLTGTVSSSCQALTPRPLTDTACSALRLRARRRRPTRVRPRVSSRRSSLFLSNNDRDEEHEHDAEQPAVLSATTEANEPSSAELAGSFAEASASRGTEA